MTDQSSSVHMTVMRRVHTIHAVRIAGRGISAALGLLVVSLYLIGREVWVARIFENMPSGRDVVAVLNFFASAFAHTELIVQALTILVIASILWMVREVGRILFVNPAQFA